MEVPFDIEHAVPNHIGNGIVLLDGSSYSEISSQNYTHLCSLLDKVGHLSSLVCSFIISFNVFIIVTRT